MAESTSESVVEFAFILFVGIALIGFIGGSASLKESEKQSVTLVETVETVEPQEEVVDEVQKESDKESSSESSASFPSKSNGNNLIAFIMIVLIVVGLFQGLPFIFRKTSEMMKVEKESKKHEKKSRTIRLGDKLKNDEGYNSAKYLVSSANQLDDLSIILADKEIDKIIFKMDAIFNTYLVDRFKFAMLMYKYENSFRVIDKSIRDSVNSKLFFADKTELQESIDEIISIAYTEIVKEKGFEWIYKDLKYERELVRELEKMKEMKNE